jgi:hypothetical protein
MNSLYVVYDCCALHCSLQNVLDTCTLGSDESTDRCNDKINNFMLFGAVQGPLLIDSKFVGSERQTAEVLLAQLEDVRSQIHDWGTTDTAYVSDNCNVQQLMRTTYSLDNDRESYGCAAHAYNLVNKGILS